MSAVDNLRKTAKRWLKSLREGDPEARARLDRAYPGTSSPPTLRDVQHALARERGHENWIALTHAAAAASAAGAADAPDTPLTALLSAANAGDAAAVARLLDEHPHILNERGTLTGHTGLRTALHFGVEHEPIVRLLLARGADPNIRDEGDHAYPIHFAAERGDLPVVTLLIEHGADPIGSGTTHLLDAVGWAVCFDYAMQVDVARYLLAHGATQTLVSAVAMGDVDAIRAVAAAGADLNQRMDRTNQRRTPPHLAVIKKQPASLAALIALGADLTLSDAAGVTPLDQAALQGEDEMVRLLIDAGAPITLPAAIALDRHEDIERLLRDNPDALSMTSRDRWATLVVQAAGRAPGRVIDTLLRTLTRYRAGLSVVNVEAAGEVAVDWAPGYTPLHAAAFHGNDDAIAVLLRHGANPRARDGKYCGTPAGWAAHMRHKATLQRLLEADIDIFDAIAFDRADRVRDILDRDPGALDRPFKAYASCPAGENQFWPTPDTTPIEWATREEKTEALRVLTERAAATRPGVRTQNDAQGAEHAERITTFLQSACWDHHVHGKRDHRMHDRAAQRLLAQDPSIAAENLYTAIVCGNRDEVARVLAARPDAVRQRGGPRGWTPILYLAYTRFTHPATVANAVEIARLLLDGSLGGGADPNDFYMAGDARYTVLAGVAGEGEQDAPRQPYAAALLDLLLERGAEPFDVQVLYNTHFSGDMVWWLDLVYARTIHTARGAAWSDPDWMMFDMGAYGSGARFVLETAIKTRTLALAEWALEHGANPNAAAARDRRFPQRSLYEFAVLEHQGEMAELLADHGAVRSEPVLSEPERFFEACLRLDRDEAQRILTQHPDYLRSPMPLHAAAKRDRPDVLAMLLDLGFPIEAQDHSGKRALHEAAVNNALGAAKLLIERGAEIDPRESIYNGTPLGWASHGDRLEMVDFLSHHSREIWVLGFRGYVDRVRELLAEDPGRARTVSKEGYTPLWWLPDDDDKAMQIVELLLAAGADASVKNKEGATAAEWARRRGMAGVAARLDRAAATTRAQPG